MLFVCGLNFHLRVAAAHSLVTPVPYNYTWVAVLHNVFTHRLKVACLISVPYRVVSAHSVVERNARGCWNGMRDHYKPHLPRKAREDQKFPACVSLRKLTRI
jgi:hypothetical protein